jgi:multicomponent Na+:H+ antiporter subunit E
MNAPLLFGILAAAYLALTGNLEAANLAVAALLAAAITAMSGSRGMRIDARRFVRASAAAAWHGLHLALDMWRSGLGVAALVLRPSLPVRPGLLRVPAGSDSETVTALSAHALSITPGQLVVGIDEEGRLWTHCLDASGGVEKEVRAQDRRRRVLEQATCHPKAERTRR